MFNLVQLLANRVKSAGENGKMEKSAVVLGNSLPNPGPTRLGQLAGVNETKASHQTGLTKELTNPYQPSVAPKPTEGLTAFTGNDAVKDVSHSPVRSSVAPVAPKPSQFTRIPRTTEPRGVGIGKVARNTGISDCDGNLYVNTEDVELLGKLGFDIDVDEYIELEKTSEVLDLYSYIKKEAGVPKAVSKAVDKGEAFSGSLLEDMGYSVPKGYEIKGDLCCPVEKTALLEKESFEKTAAAEPSQTILITGHSGSGKTTLSRQLAEKLNIPVRRVDAHRGWDNYIRGDDKRWKETLTPGTKEHSYFTDLVHRATRDTLKNAPEAGIIEGTQLGHLSPEELAKFKAHIVVGGSRDQSILQRIQRSVDKAAKSGVTFSPEEMDTKRIKAKYVADFWEPGIEKFRKLPSVLHYNHSEHELEPLIKKLQRLLSKKASTDTPYSRPTVENPYPGIIGDGALMAGEFMANRLANSNAQAALGKSKVPPNVSSLLGKARMYGNIVKAAPAVGAVAQANGAYDRYKKQDYLGSAIDGVGALGSAAQMAPHPVAKGVGLGVSAASTVANAGRDIHRYNNRPVEFRHDPAILSNPGEASPSQNPVQIPNAPLAKQGEATHELEKEASKASRRVMEVLRKVNPAKRQELIGKLHEANISKYSTRLGYKVDDLALGGKALARAEELKDSLSKIKVLNRDPDKTEANYNLLRRYLTDKNIREETFLTKAKEQAIKVKNWTLSEHDIADSLRRDRSIENRGVADIRNILSEAPDKKQIFEALRNTGKANAPAHLVAQYPTKQEGLGELLFTPHLAKADINERKAALAKYLEEANSNVLAGRNKDWQKKENYETVINKQNIEDPSKKLTARYFIPAEKSAPSAVAPQSLPQSDQGYMYKGGPAHKIRESRNLGKLVDRTGFFYSGDPTVAAGYAVGRDAVGRKERNFLQPAGFRELRKYLSGQRTTKKDNLIADNLNNYFKPVSTVVSNPSFGTKIRLQTQHLANRLGLFQKAASTDTPLAKQGEANIPLVSSNIKAVGYDKREKELEVHFHSGGEYKYSDVPASLFHRLLKVKSPGKFFHKHIKKDNPFEYERLNKAAGIPEHVRKAMINGEREVLQRSQKASVASRLKNIAAKKHKDELSRLIDMGEEKVVHPASSYNNQTSLKLNLPETDYERTQKYILPRKS